MRTKILIIISILSFMLLGGRSVIKQDYRNNSINEMKNEINLNLTNELVNVVMENENIEEEMEVEQIDENEQKTEIPKEEISEGENSTIINNNKAYTKENSSNNAEQTEIKKQYEIVEEVKLVEPQKQETKKEETPVVVEEPKKEEIVRCTNNNNHGMGVGNSEKWFNSKQEAINYYDSQTAYWNNWVKEDPDTRWDEYLNKCPSGYEVWSCMFCNKWTINFYYR